MGQPAFVSEAQEGHSRAFKGRYERKDEPLPYPIKSSEKSKKEPRRMDQHGLEPAGCKTIVRIVAYRYSLQLLMANSSNLVVQKARMKAEAKRELVINVMFRSTAARRMI